MGGLPTDSTIVEMLPRDGFQSLGEFIPTDEKVEIINRISNTGIDEIEFTSFAHPKSVPNLKDAEKVASEINRNPDVTYRALIPNAKGMERAVNVDVDKVNMLVSVSESYSRRNQNRSHEEIEEEIEDIIALAEKEGIIVEAGLATSFYCPYEGRIAPKQTLEVIDMVIDKGVDEVTLATTMGLADPKQVRDIVKRIDNRWPNFDFGLHLHDTNGMSLANSLIAMEFGINRFDTSMCGVGGGVVLPDHLPDIGNTPTEDLLHMLSRMDICKDDLFKAVAQESNILADRLDISMNSHVARGGTAHQILADLNEAGK